MNLNAVRYLDSQNVHLDPFFIALWKHVFVVEIIKQKYQVTSPETKRSILATLKQRVKNDQSKQMALEYLDEFGQSFWSETEERIREITSKFEIDTGIKGGLSGGVSPVAIATLALGKDQRFSETVRSEEAQRFQHIVNSTQLHRLHKMIEVLDSDILNSPDDFTYIVIDDLDSDWVDEKICNTLIRCLFRAVMDLQKVKNLKVVVALRTNIFDYLEFGARAGGQEEKIRSLSLRVQWTRRDLVNLLDERAKIAVRESDGTAIKGIVDLLPAKAKKKVEPFDSILKQTSMRPRDVIAYLNEAFRSGPARTGFRGMTSKMLRLPIRD